MELNIQRASMRASNWMMEDRCICDAQYCPFSREVMFGKHKTLISTTTEYQPRIPEILLRRCQDGSQVPLGGDLHIRLFSCLSHSSLLTITSCHRSIRRISQAHSAAKTLSCPIYIPKQAQYHLQLLTAIPWSRCQSKIKLSMPSHKLIRE